MTKRQKGEKTKREKGEKEKKTKDKRQRPKREFYIVTSGQFRTLAMFLFPFFYLLLASDSCEQMCTSRVMCKWRTQLQILSDIMPVILLICSDMPMFRVKI